MPSGPSDYATNPTIFLRMNGTDSVPREMAWNEFRARYAPIIAHFAMRLGARAQDVDDVIQDVLLGFYLKSPTFIYDPSKGRFRGYLRVCTYHAARHRMGREAKFLGRSLDAVDPSELAIEQAWDEVWERQQLCRALESMRAECGGSKTFQAFEQYVLLGRPGQEVADELGMHVNSVYRAKLEHTQELQARMLAMGDD